MSSAYAECPGFHACCRNAWRIGVGQGGLLGVATRGHDHSCRRANCFTNYVVYEIAVGQGGIHNASGVNLLNARF